MARPTKSAKVLTECSQTKDEITERIENEEKLKGNSDAIIPPDYLNENQVYLFNYIKSQLKESQLLGNLDVYILAKCAIAIDRLQTIEEKINLKPGLLLNTQIMSAKDKYDKDFYRCCNELSLSPQSRAKLANINLSFEKKKTDPTLNIIRKKKEHGYKKE